MPENQFLRSWGIVYQNDITYSAEYECLECGWEWIDPKRSTLEAIKERYKALVGFSTSVVTGSVKSHVVGIFIIECPKCFSKFWFHCTEGNVDLAKKFCESWPKD